MFSKKRYYTKLRSHFANNKKKKQNYFKKQQTEVTGTDVSVSGAYYINISVSYTMAIIPIPQSNFRLKGISDKSGQTLLIIEPQAMSKTNDDDYVFTVNPALRDGHYYISKILHPKIGGTFGFNHDKYIIDIHPKGVTGWYDDFRLLPTQPFNNNFTVQIIDEQLNLFKQVTVKNISTQFIQLTLDSPNGYKIKWQFKPGPKENLPLPEPQPGPQPLPPNPSDPYVNPINYGKYYIRNNHTKTFINYSIGDFNLILSKNPLLWEAKITHDGNFYIHSPQFTSYILIDENNKVVLSPNPQTIFQLQKPSISVAQNKYCIHSLSNNLNLSAITANTLGVNSQKSYQQVFQMIIQVPEPAPQPQNISSFQINPINSSYFKQMKLKTNDKDERQFQFYNSGPKIQLHPQEQATVPLGYKQGHKPDSKLWMVLKPHQGQFSKSLLGQTIHIGKKGKQYVMKLFNGGKKKEVIQSGEAVATGTLQNSAIDQVQQITQDLI